MSLHLGLCIVMTVDYYITQMSYKHHSSISFNSFIHSDYSHLFKSTTTQMHSRHSIDSVPEFHTKAPQETASERLAQAPTWSLERDLNLRPFGRTASDLPMRHHAPCRYR